MKEQIIDELLNYFLKESHKDKEISVPNDLETKRLLLRGLVNLREPNPLDENILELEDKLLQLELKEKKVTDALELPEVEKNISLFKGDITTIKADVIVNAGNSYGLGCFNPNHGCIDNAIHTYAGIRLRLECNEKLQGKKLNNGDILVCKGYNLPSKYVITTVGPQVFRQISKQDEEDLKNCYKNALEYAVKNNFKTIVFPSISTGVFAYPIGKAKIIAFTTVKEFLKDHDIKVVFNLFSEDDYREYANIFRD